MSLNRKNWKLSTQINHPEEVSLKEGNRPLIAPVVNSAKFVISEKHSLNEQFIYGRVGNPTLRQLELTLGEIQKKDECIVVSSGIGAITGTILGLLKSGDHMITFRELYKPSRVFIRDILPNYNISSTFLSLNNLSDLEKNIIQDKTRLIYFESPSNPNLQIADIPFLISIARKHNLIIVMDGTFGGLHQHTEFDLDIIIHSLTKFANGHGDVIAGSIAGKKDIVGKIKEMVMYLGAHLDPQATYLIQRGLKTYMLRYERQTETAQKMAEYLQKQPGVTKVYYPGLEIDLNYKTTKSHMKSFGSVISFEIDSKMFSTSEEFCQRLKLIQVAVSLGSTETIICPTLAFFGLDLSEVERKEMGINSHSFRLSIGIEDFDDLKNDLHQAFRVQY